MLGLHIHHKILLLLIAGVFLLAIAAGLVTLYWQERTRDFAACTMEAKICPDGSFVGRVGPYCEFTACPAPEAAKDWITFTDAVAGITFQYPPQLFAIYTLALDWPPRIELTNKPLSCTQADSKTSFDGKVTHVVVNGRPYCATSLMQGGAGSIYTRYTYEFAKEGKTAVFSFSLRHEQCDNYDEPERSACTDEQELFSMNEMVDAMAQTLVVTPKDVGQAGGIKGKVWIGPTCPVLQYPPNEQCNDKPHAAAFMVDFANGTKNITKFTSDKDGNFAVELAPGEYSIRSAAEMNEFPYCPVIQPIAVSGGAFTEVKILCDSGIR